jgi:hypothetical protein
MAISRSTCALAVLAIVLAAAGAEARHHHGGHGGDYEKPRARGYLVQGNSVYQQNRPKDPTPLAPTSAGPYALAHRGSSGVASSHVRAAPHAHTMPCALAIGRPAT